MFRAVLLPSRGIGFWLFEFFVAMACFILATDPGLAQDKPPLRWAVIGSRDAVASGVTDLLTVSMESQGFSMVERSQILALEQELERDIGLGALRPAIALGERVGAQRIVVCHLRPPEKSAGPPPAAPRDQPPLYPTLRVVVCDCELVARIGVASFDQQSVPSAVEKTVGYLGSDSFASMAKIDGIVMIPPFACKNLGDEFSELGRQSHEFLSDQVLAVPGIALLEWDAAQVLTREALFARAFEQRRIPYSVEIDYRVIPQSGDSIPHIEVTRRVATVGMASAGPSSAEPATDETVTLPLSEFEPWLRARVLPELLERAKGDDRIDKIEQLRILKQRADSMQRLGIPWLTAQIREVTLQIDPNDRKERLRLVDDYGQIAKATELRRRMALFPMMPHELQARSLEREHFEYLVQNRQITFRDAVERLQALLLDPFSDIALSRISPKFALGPLDMEWTLASLEQDDRFVRAVAPAVLRLKKPGELSFEEELQWMRAWTKAVLTVPRVNTWFHFGDEASRIKAIELILDIVPQDFPTTEVGAAIFSTNASPKRSVLITPDYRKGDYKQKRFEVGSWPEEVLDFNAKYATALHRHLQLYFQLSRLQHQFANPLQLFTSYPKDTQPVAESMEVIESEVNALRKLAKQTYGADVRGLTGPNQIYFDYVYDLTTRYIVEIRRRVEGTPNPTIPEVPSLEPGFGRLRFHELALEPPELQYDSLRWQPDGPEHDLVFDHRSIYRLDRSGVFQAIHTNAEHAFIDEDYIWEIVKQEGTRCRVAIMDRKGSKVVSDDSIDLPPCEAFQAFGSGPGKGVVIGWFDGGTWCGEIAFRDGQIAFHVFHEARDYYRANIPEEFRRAMESIETRFEPTWHAFGQDAHGPMLLLGRYSLYPLRIDLATKKVRVVPLRNSHFAQDTKIVGNHLYSSQYSFVQEWDLDSKETVIPEVMVVGTDHMEHVRNANTTAGNHRGTMLVDGEWLLFPGQTWYRYHGASRRTERLVPTALPRPWDQGLYGMSSIYGPVVAIPKSDQTQAKLYRVEVLPEPASETRANPEQKKNPKD